MRTPKWLLAVVLPAVLLLAAAAFVYVRVQHSLNRAGAAVAREGRYPFTLRDLQRPENPGFEAIASPAAYVSGAFYRGKLYVSSPSGLFVFGNDHGIGDGIGGRLLKTYRVGLDLPAAPLGQIVVGLLRGMGEPELIIATRGEGVLTFTASGGEDASEGSGIFRQIRPEDAEARDVTALLPLATGELLIGTRRRGLLVYRGLTPDNSLEAFDPQLTGLEVTELAADVTGFWAGTRNQGLRHFHAGQVDSFVAASAAAGGVVSSNVVAGALPDDEVDSIAVHGNKVYVGTPLGVEEFDDGRPARVLAANLFANALFADEKAVTVGSMDEGIRRVSLDTGRRPSSAFAAFSSIDDPTEPVQQFLGSGAGANEGGELFAVMRSTLLEQRNGGGWTALITDSASAKSGAPVLTDSNISALAFDADGRLWIGYFDRGLDILSSPDALQGGPHVVHREDDRLFCINRIVADPRRKTMAVATANGLVLFDARGKPRQTLTRRDGLIADHVNDIAFTGETMVLATPAGLTYADAAGARSLYAFEGLVNNHVYALGSRPGSNEILAGTLGGISDLVDESVRRNLTATNSGLKHNWITAIVPVTDPDSNATWMVGTYGAGVMLLGKDGRFQPMQGATRQMEVNPNAMLVTSSHVFAGTLGDGLWAYSLAAGHWSQITGGLPSKNVTALAERQGELYVGTENGLVRIAERLLE